MTDAESRLAVFFGEDGLAQHDHLFALAVAERLARRRFHAGLLWLAGVSALGGLIFWALAPSLGAWLVYIAVDPAALAPVAVGLVIAASLVVITAAPPWAGRDGGGAFQAPPQA